VTMDILHVLVQQGGTPTLSSLDLHTSVVSPASVEERELAALLLDRTHVIGVTPALGISRTGGLGGCEDQEWFRDGFWIILSCGLLGTESLHVTATISGLHTTFITPTVFVRASSTSIFTTAGIQASNQFRSILWEAKFFSITAAIVKMNTDVVTPTITVRATATSSKTSSK